MGLFKQHTLFRSSQITKLEGQGPNLRAIYHTPDFQWSCSRMQKWVKIKKKIKKGGENLQEKKTVNRVTLTTTMILYHLQFAETPAINYSSSSSWDPLLLNVFRELLLMENEAMEGGKKNRGTCSDLKQRGGTWLIPGHIYRLHHPWLISSDWSDKGNIISNQSHNPRSALKQDLSLNQMIVVTS